MDWIVTLSKINEGNSKILNADDLIVSISEFSILSSVSFFARIGCKFLIHDRLMKIFGFVRLKLVVSRTPSSSTKSAMSLKDALNDVVPKTSLFAINCQTFSTMRLISNSPSNDLSDKITLLRFLKLISGKFPQIPCSACFDSTTWLCVILKSSRGPWMVSELILLLLAKKPFLIVNLDLSPSVMLRALPKNGSRSPSSSAYSYKKVE